MSTKQLLICGFLLLSAIAPVSAMQLEAAEECPDAMQLKVMEFETSLPKVVEDAEMAVSSPAIESEGTDNSALMNDSIDINFEQESLMKKKLAPSLDIAEDMSMDKEAVVVSVAPLSSTEVAAPEIAEPEVTTLEMTTSELPIEEVQPAIEDNQDDQRHADVQGVFESMSREEEDETFPG